MSYEEAMYFKQKSKQKALDKMEQKRMDIVNNTRLMPDTSYKDITLGKSHINSIADALRKVNPNKWR